MLDALIITLMNNANSIVGSRRCMESLERSVRDSIERILILPATTPETLGRDIMTLSNNPKYKHSVESLFSEARRDSNVINNIRYTWPITPEQNRLDLKTGLYLKAYKAANVEKVAACTISHLRAWLYALEHNKDVLVLEHDALFIRSFKFEELYKKNNKFGVIALNSPYNATRRAVVYDTDLKVQYDNDPFKLAYNVPEVNLSTDPSLPQGLPGNSAYIVQPWAAEQLIDKVAEVGIWPNDALICREFFPWIKSIYPYVTKVQGTPSTTTS